MANRMPRIASSRAFFLNVGRGAAWCNGVRKGVKLLMIVCRFCLFLLSYRIGGGASRGLSRKVMFLVTNYRIFLTRRTSCHAENHGWSRMSVMNFLFITNYRIFELILSITRRIAEVTDFLCPEFSNCRINTFNHTENLGRSRVFVTRLVLWTH